MSYSSVFQTVTEMEPILKDKGVGRDACSRFFHEMLLHGHKSGRLVVLYSPEDLDFSGEEITCGSDFLELLVAQWDDCVIDRSFLYYDYRQQEDVNMRDFLRKFPKLKKEWQTMAELACPVVSKDAPDHGVLAAVLHLDCKGEPPHMHILMYK